MGYKLKSRWVDRALSVIALLICAAVFLTLPHDVPGTSITTFTDMESAAFFPMLAASVIGSSAMLLVLSSFMRRSKQLEEQIDLMGKRPALLVVGFSLFIPLIHWLGMVIASTIMIALLPMVFRYQNYRLVIPLAMLLPIAVYLLFERVLKVLFPHGVVF